MPAQRIQGKLLEVREVAETRDEDYEEHEGEEDESCELDGIA